jgi:carbamate kinase
MIGYLIQQELRNVLPQDSAVVTVLTMIAVDPDDPAFANPTKFVGPGYTKDVADALAADKRWTFRQDGAAWRRVVPSPQPQQILEIDPIRCLIDHGSVVVCAGGGGIPTIHSSSATGALTGVEAVIDKDLASELLSEDIDADLFVMATDVDGVYLDWGGPAQRRLGMVTPEDLNRHRFAAGSMGPKVEAASRFVLKTGRRAAIGALADIGGIVDGAAGTSVVPTARGTHQVPEPTTGGG